MHHSYLLDVLVLLIAAMACVPVFERLRLGPVLGYLAAGALIGPSGLKLIGDVEATRALAEFGVVFLLFTIGLELTVERVRLISGRVYALGFLQIVVTAAVLTIVARLFGLGLAAAIIIGGALALSSTAIVMPLLSKLGKMNTSVGRMAVAILLMQDLAVGPLLVLIEALAGAQSAGAADAGMGGDQLATELGLAVIQAAAAIAVIFAAGRILFRPLFRLVAATNSPELFVGMALLVALATSWGTEVAGLSLAFGGFLAGVLLAETEFRHQVAADVQPFRGLLLGLFFMTVGMSVDLRVAATEFGAVLGLAVALMLVKGVLIAGLARLFAVPGPRALRLGAFLSQGGEFAFVALGAAALAGLIPDAAAQLIIAAAVVTMAATPLVGSAVRRGASPTWRPAVTARLRASWVWFRTSVDTSSSSVSARSATSSPACSRPTISPTSSSTSAPSASRRRGPRASRSISATRPRPRCCTASAPSGRWPLSSPPMRAGSPRGWRYCAATSSPTCTCSPAALARRRCSACAVPA